LSVAFSLLKEGPKELIYDSIEVISYMAKAAMAEISIRGKMDVTTAGWREIALGKTGVLFAWCGKAAARIAGDEDAAFRFYKCGLHIGIAFQLVDDLRDLQDKKELKDRFSDIKNREPSFPILLSLGDLRIKDELANLWAQEEMSNEGILRIGEDIIACGAVQKTSNAAKLEIEAAIDALGYFQETSGGKQISQWLKELYQTACDGF
jgi:geranylgeranyl pyrophosphate synthase